MAGRILTLDDQGQIIFKEGTGGGTSGVTLTAPATLAGDITFTLPTALPGSTLFMQSDSSGNLSFAAGTSSLDTAYDNGSTIAVDTGSIAITVTAAVSGIEINKTDVNAGDALNVINAGTGIGFDLSQTGVAIATRLQQSADTTNVQLNKLGTGVGSNLALDNDGTGINIFSNQDGNGIALSIDSEATSQPLIELLPITSNTRGDIAFGTARTADPTTPSEGDVWYDSTAANLVLYDGVSNKDLTQQDTQNDLDGAYDDGSTITADAGAVQINVTSTNVGLDVVKTDTDGNNAVQIENDGTGDGLFINQDGNGKAIEIDSEATSEPSLSFLQLNTNTRGDIAFDGARTADPSGPTVGDVWFNTTDNALLFKSGPAFSRVISNQFSTHFGALTTAVIATGVVSVSAPRIQFTSETGATDTVDTINTVPQARDGDEIIVMATSGDDITLGNDTGNLKLDGSNIVLLGATSVNNNARLMWDDVNSYWIELSRKVTVTA